MIRVQDLATRGASKAGNRQVDDMMLQAPEVAAGGAKSEKSDVYSFAMCMYEIYAARLPFDPDSLGMSALQVVAEQLLGKKSCGLRCGILCRRPTASKE